MQNRGIVDDVIHIQLKLADIVSKYLLCSNLIIKEND